MKSVKSVFFLLCSFYSAQAVTHLYINNTSSYTITSLPAKIVLSCDAASLGNNLTCEIYIDINGNRQVDTYDERIYYLNLVDGLGSIYDGDNLENCIPGDDTGRDGFIRTTILCDQNLRAYSRQTWLIRITDQDFSFACAQLHWDIPVASSTVSGCVRDAASAAPLANVLVHFHDVDYPDAARLALTDSVGDFTIALAPGDWQFYTSHPVNKSYRRTDPQNIQLNEAKKLCMNIDVEKYDSFICGFVHFENKSPVENITIAFQNTKTMELFHLRTDEQGRFSLGIEPGRYVMTVSQYFSRFTGNHYWPEGFYARPAVDTLIVKGGQTLDKNIAFTAYPAFIRGRCVLGEMPLADALVQGIAVDPATREQKLFQTFSKSDGSFLLGVFQSHIKSILAQKQGYLAEPLSGFQDISAYEIDAHKNFDFHFKKQTGLMSLSGAVYGQANQALEGVYVAAYNIWEPGPEGHLVTRTNVDGKYFFDIKVEGDWQIGVFKSDAQVQPEMYYKYLSPGLIYNNLNFTVADDKSIDTVKGELMSADFNIMPRFPNPFYKETVIDFVLPKSSHTQVDVLDMDGHELTTLVDHDLSSGYQKVCWDGTDSEGNMFANGVYLCRIISHERTTVLPITLLR
ncbi:hypothetical protein EH223_12135 [candidate division KSB1 bacterium]|nr:hypothetical protein [candidate division KSB1 bacterium]RQW02576.1 MAG: hypothetical protein EH223_12135 [candidate division KSB1 bacterium]